MMRGAWATSRRISVQSAATAWGVWHPNCLIPEQFGSADVRRPVRGVAVVEFCIHLANMFYLASFLGRDMLWLRALTCAGLTLGLVFFTCRPAPLYGPAVWHAAFLLINGVQIVRLVRERRELALTEEQERVGVATLEHLSRDELLTLVTRAVHARPATLRDLERACQHQLTPEELALRDIALRRLSYRELLNLAVRRLWGVMKGANPARWRRQSGDSPGSEPAPTAV